MRPGAPRLAELLSCHLVLVLLMCRPGLPADQQDTKKTLTIGYLAALTGTLKDRQGLAVSGALSMALQQVNNNPSILKNIELVLRWNDTKGDRVRATLVITEMLCDGVAAFIGPEGSCFVESIVSQSRNVPMISYDPDRLRGSRSLLSGAYKGLFPRDQRGRNVKLSHVYVRMAQDLTISVRYPPIIHAPPTRQPCRRHSFTVIS
ncbi:hypothetical protein B7P43_G07107 [Cryptotermes secundus]|uniref:Receptor ligand binding region domain-containing protein n=1 Tax=Cryptotermes secundus TaxID=105785 RepID=A0A2J7Q258_9NEOP|nr:hypothetical protein B7P43_G07107 [Cryptotermes secundus]